MSIDPDTIEPLSHHHRFLGQGYEQSERKTWTVIWLCGAMMCAEIIGGLLFGSIALVADGLHMSTHAGALLLAALAKKRLRPLAMALEFSTVRSGSPWLAALRWMKEVFSRGQTLDQRPLTELPQHTIPKRLRNALLVLDESGTPTRLAADRYELWVYRQIRKRLDAGELHLDESIQYRAFGDELVPLEQKEAALRQLDIPWLRRPVEAELGALFAELDQRWRAFDRALRRGTLKHLQFEATT